MSNFLQNAIWILQDAMQIITVCKRGAKQTVLGTGTRLPAIKVHMHQRPPAATDQRACMGRPAAAAAVGAIFDHGYPGF